MNGPLGYGGSMNCKEFEKNIPDFISGKLDFLTLQEFGEHMEKCPGCKEELVIQFLVTEGMQRLESARNSRNLFLRKNRAVFWRQSAR